MTLPPKLEKLLDNWPAKIVSLVAAIFVYAFYQISTLETRYFVVPLEINQSAGMISTDVSESSVRIAIRGKVSDITTLETKDFHAYTDLSRLLGEGKEVVPIQLALSDNVRILNDVEIKIEPETVEVTTEKEYAEYVPVLIHYSGGTAHGYEIESVRAIPPLVKVRGPESLVKNMTGIETDVILLDELSQNAVFESELLDVNRYLSVSYEGPVSIEVNVVPSQMNRIMTNLPIEAYVSDISFDFDVEKKTGSCTVSGNQLDVEMFNPVKGFLFIDCSNIAEPGEYDVPVQSRNAYMLNVDSITPETVHVIVTERMEESQEESEE